LLDYERKKTIGGLILEMGDLTVAIAFAMFGILVAIGAYELGLWESGKPGAGLMPFCLGIILSFSSFLILYGSVGRVRRVTKSREKGIWSDVDFKKVAIVLTSLLFYYVLLERVGLLITAFFSLLMLFKVVGSQRWRWALIQTILALIVVYILFIVILNVYMPLFPTRLG
jgi:hypothetical protein